MKREERKIYTKCIAVMAVYIIAGVWFYTMPCNAEICHIDGLEESDGKIIEETPIVAETGQIREDRGMPCVNREQFERWYATYEQETEEETRVEIDFVPDVREDVPQEVPTVQSSEVETSAEVETATVGNIHTQYSVNGETLNPDIQAYLYQRLADHNIEWFMPYAVMIAYQESHFDQYDVSDDGKDYGLLQFRAEFWDWKRGDIFDPYAQVDVFVENMARRANMGLDLYEMISRHMQSDYGSYNHEYVATVLSHEPNLKEVEQ